MEFKDLKVGDKVIVVTIGNNARYETKKFEGTVLSIGRKWFKVNTQSYFDSNEKYSLEDGKSDGKGYAPEWQVFKSEKDYLESIDKPNLLIQIKRDIGILSYQQLKHIEQLIKEATTI